MIRVATTHSTLLNELRSLVGAAHVLPGTDEAYLRDASESSGLRGNADGIVLPGSAQEVATVLAWCYANDVPIVPRGGGTGYAGGAVPFGGVVLALERLTRIKQFDPLLWRLHVDAGVRTADVRRIARESGLYFPVDPGAAEQSQIGGNIATNAGGPHAFKYGVTGAWVTGLEVAVSPGELITVGGPIRKDAAGYDLKSLFIGSEGTLGIVTSAWLRLIPAPEAAFPVAAFYPGVAEGCDAIERVLGSGLLVAALEYSDQGTLAAAAASFPGTVADGAKFAVIAEVDGSQDEATRLRKELIEALDEGATSLHAPMESGDIASLWRWRDGVSIAVTARRGGKLSEDIVVPVDRLAEAIERIVDIGERHGLPACSWGHAGDGNLHATFLLQPGAEHERAAAEAAAHDLFLLAVELGGSISGEHGIGCIKLGELERQWAPGAMALHRAVKHAFDPKGLLNPGKKA